MITLSSLESGEIGTNGVAFSELYAAACIQRFTGGILVKVPKDAAVFFRDGSPVHTGGAGFESHFLGQVLIEKGAITTTQLELALERQAKAQGVRPLLGAILVQDAGLDPATVKRAIQAQTEGRILGLFGITSAIWQAAKGENARIREVGVVSDGMAILMAGFRSHLSDDELRKLSDTLLGKAVQLSGDPPDLQFDAAEQKFLRYLDKPRKPDQLERASNRRMTRALLRLLVVLDKLQIHPASRGIPIPKATLLKGQAGFQPSATLPDDPSPPPSEDASPRAPTPAAAPAPKSTSGDPSPIERAPSRSQPDPGRNALLEEVRTIHADLEKKTYFELLGVTDETSVADIRKSFAALAKKFHPDAFPGGLAEDLNRMVSEVAARMNEAYQTLSNEKSRAEYIALLSDERIKGDSRKAEKIRDAEIKYHMGVVMLRKKDFQKAREYFNYAVQSDPACGEYKASFAWAMFIDSKFDRQEALSKGYGLLLEALKCSNVSATTHYYTGEILKAKDQAREALFHFHRAVELDPKLTEAAREIRLIEMRAHRDERGGEDKKSGISKLFKR